MTRTQPEEAWKMHTHSNTRAREFEVLNTVIHPQTCMHRALKSINKCDWAIHN